MLATYMSTTNLLTYFVGPLVDGHVNKIPIG
jgi:hypothetical protein